MRTKVALLLALILVLALASAGASVSPFSLSTSLPNRLEINDGPLHRHLTDLPLIQSLYVHTIQLPKGTSTLSYCNFEIPIYLLRFLDNTTTLLTVTTSRGCGTGITLNGDDIRTQDTGFLELLHQAVGESV